MEEIIKIEKIVKIQLYKNYNSITNVVHNYNSRNSYFQPAHSKPIITTNNEKIKKYYNTPFSTVSVSYDTIKIKRISNKISIIVSCISKERKYYNRWFKTHKRFNIFSMDLLTGNFYVCTKVNRSNNIRRNSFKTLFNFLTYIDHIYWYPGKHNLNLIFKKLGFNITSDVKDDFHIIADKFVELKNIKTNDVNDVFHIIADKFVELKNIKTNDNYYDLIKNFYPTEKYLKRNDRKLISSILDKYNIKSKSIVKFLHEYPDVDVDALSILLKFFGDDYNKFFGNINKTILGKMLSSCFVPRIDVTYNLNNIEKKNLLNLLNDNIDGGKILVVIADHISMIENINGYGLNYRFKKTTSSTLLDDHKKLTKILEFLLDNSISFTYSNNMLDIIKEPIIVSGNKFIPYLLSSKNDYIDESNHMHHCVSSYFNREHSIIISIRKDDNFDRVTCEYNIKNGKRIQCSYFSNEEYPEEYEQPLKILDRRIYKLFNDGELIRKKEILDGRNLLQMIYEQNGDLILENI